MLKVRVIPCLLYQGSGLVKTRKFDEERYVGDPVNAIRIFNEKSVDELIFLDISAVANKRPPDLEVIRDIASECFMPLCYGGGISDMKQIEAIFKVGVEKVAINTNAIENPSLVAEAGRHFGSQSIVVSLDVKRNMFGKYSVHTHNGKRNQKMDPVETAKRMEGLGAGELFINSIDRDGMQNGYDIDLLHKVSNAVSIPVIGCGGAGKIEHLAEAVEKGGVSAVAAGSLFVFHGKFRAVLISYPEMDELERLLGTESH